LKVGSVFPFVCYFSECATVVKCKTWRWKWTTEGFFLNLQAHNFHLQGRYHGTAYLRYADTKEIKLCARGRFILWGKWHYKLLFRKIENELFCNSDRCVVTFKLLRSWALPLLCSSL